MKRIHRRAHLVIWMLLVPTLIMLLVVGMKALPTEPVNEVLPTSLTDRSAD